MFVKHEDSVRRQIVIARKSVAGQEIVHGFVKLDSHRRTLVIEKKINFHINMFINKI